jgi:transcriptional antiterminator
MSEECMETYTIKKILNNNVIIAEKNKIDFVLVGKAIGFDFNKGSKLPEDRIENIFVKQNSTSNENFDRILQNINNEIIGISEEIISMCEKELGIKLSEALHVSLPDHVNFALRRIKEGIIIENPFLQELKALYPKEYKLADKALFMINNTFNSNLPEDEIGFICLHIKAATEQQNVGSSLEYTRKIGEVMDIISKLLKRNFDKNSLSYIRTITHLNFMIERIKSKKTIKNHLLDTIKKELYNDYDIAIKVAMKIENLFSIKVPEDEIGYIALHLKRLTEI